MPKSNLCGRAELSIGEYIRAIMRRKKVTETALAEAIGMRQSNLSRRFSKGNFRADELIMIFRFLEFTDKEIAYAMGKTA